MNRTIGSFAAGMAVVAVALIGYNVVAGRGTDNGGVGGPAEPSPAAVAVPSPNTSSPPASEAPAGDGGLAVSFVGSLPEGWSQGETTFSHGEDATIEIFENRSIMSTIPDCIYGPAEGIGTSASEFVAALATREGLDVGGPEPAEVGGLSGDALDIGMSQDWTGTCPWWEAGTPVVPTYGAFDEKNYWLFQAASGDERYRLYVLDVPGGGNVVISIYAATPEVMATYADDAAAIVEGIVFDVGP